MPLQLQYTPGILEAGLDEAGRGCLAGPVVAAAVILPPDFEAGELTDSKQLNAAQRERLRHIIMEKAVAWKVAVLPPSRIDEINILNASLEAMVIAYKALRPKPQELLVDGNRFKPQPIPHRTMVKGDGKYLNIAAASVLAKTHRDDLMLQLHKLYPMYAWDRNKGYPTADHRKAIQEHGPCEHHRRSFTLLPPLTLF
jgi:ribonuclease HII